MELTHNELLIKKIFLFYINKYKLNPLELKIEIHTNNNVFIWGEKEEFYEININKIIEKYSRDKEQYDRISKILKDLNKIDNLMHFIYCIANINNTTYYTKIDTNFLDDISKIKNISYEYEKNKIKHQLQIEFNKNINSNKIMDFFIKLNNIKEDIYIKDYTYRELSRAIISITS